MSFFDEIENKVREAEKIDLRNRNRYPSKKIEWRSTACPKCQGRVEYFPKEGFTGDLKCPHCQKAFHLSRLEDFVGEEK